MFQVRGAVLPSERAWKAGDGRRFLCEGKRRCEGQKKCRGANNLWVWREFHALTSREDGRPDCLRLYPARDTDLACPPAELALDGFPAARDVTRQSYHRA